MSRQLNEGAVGRLGRHLAAEDLYGIGQLAGRILEDLNVWVNIHDNDLNILYWNEVAERLSGYRAAEVVGSPQVWELCYPDRDYRESIQKKADEIVHRGEPVMSFRNEIVCHNGETRYMSWNSRPLIDDDGSIRGAITVGYDVTELERSRETMRRVNEELSVLYDVASVAAEGRDLEAFLGRCLERVLGILGADGGCVHLVAEHGGELRLAAQVGLPAGLASELERCTPGVGYVGGVYSGGTPRVVPDIRTDTASTPTAAASGLLSYAGVPVRAEGRSRGVFSVVAYATEAFRSRDTTLMGSIAHQVGLTVENARLRKQEEQLAVLQERGRLARELHDSVSQSLYSVGLFAEAGRRWLGQGDAGRAAEYLDRLAETSHRTLKEMRLLVYELRPVELEREGLVGALGRRLEAVEHRTGVDAVLSADPGVSLPVELEEALYRIAQEALNNALKHADAERVSVVLRQAAGSVRLKVEDDGVGFEPERVSGGGLGLISIRERVEQLRGRVSLRSRPGGGTSIEVDIPLLRRVARVGSGSR